MRCTDNDLKYIDPAEPYQILILYRVLDHIMELRQITNGATVLQLAVASAAQMTKDSLPEYKPKYIIHQTHLML